MPAQFAHVQTYSRKRNRAGQYVEQVIGELLREPGYSSHVPEPAPPQIVDGVSAEKLREEHDAMIKAAQALFHIKGRENVRAVRKDRHTLATAIVSYPFTYKEITGNLEKEQALKNWEKANIRFFHNFFGKHYRAMFRHTDETFPHLHIYALPVGLAGIDASLLHPGRAAKRTVEARLKSEGLPPREAVAAGNRALKTAMRAWQDQYYREVGEPCGLLRTGPQRERLSRAQYKAREAEARLRSTSVLEKRKALLELAGHEMRQQIKNLEAWKMDIAERSRALDVRETVIRTKEEQLQAAIRILRESGNRMRTIISFVAVFLGLERTSKIENGLAVIEDALRRIENDTFALNSNVPDISIPIPIPAAM
ncbi:hypothetical protein EYC08_20710 [Tabrizicola sp. WMC-M-20]|nr:hypothetical protein EYC08_20710 [Tabrizicola sp. WMC-M-20]